MPVLDRLVARKIPPESLEAYQRIVGKTMVSAQKEMVELLRTSGELIGEPRAITHPVKFYEKGDKPLEIVTTRQWYITNGGRDPQLRDRLIARGQEINWHPPHMRVRYENWVNGLNGDWLARHGPAAAEVERTASLGADNPAADRPPAGSGSGRTRARGRGRRADGQEGRGFAAGGRRARRGRRAVRTNRSRRSRGGPRGWRRRR